MTELHYDVVIIGAGAAGLHLALAFQKDIFFKNWSIAIIEKSLKDANDRTWCYWEQGSGKWDHLIKHSWSEGHFMSKWEQKYFDITPYRYKMLQGLDFYEYCRDVLFESGSTTWYQDEILEVIQNEPLLVKGRQKEYRAKYVFDSRLPKAFIQYSKNNKQIIQHFKGWTISTDIDTFNPDQFTMMDYRMPWKDQTGFFYVLPTTNREALIEFTLFNTELITDQDYELMLTKYIKEILNIGSYVILEQEYGIIPMSTFEFESLSTGHHILIGTAGGWVKPSSGYSFKNAERNAIKLIHNIKNNRNLNLGIISSRFRFYDTLFLDVLKSRNDLGPQLFNIMYIQNDVRKIFKFLDEETNILEDIFIIWRFPKLVFIKALFNYLYRRMREFLRS